MATGKIVLVKGRAGLGNRILAALTAIAYARISGRALLFDWSDPAYSVHGANVFRRFFDCPLSVPTDGVPTTDSVWPILWRGHLADSAREMERLFGGGSPSRVWEPYSFDLSKLDYEEDVLVMWTYTEQINRLRDRLGSQLADFAGLTKQAILRKLLHEDLTLRPEIRERVERFRASRLARPTVGVHVRFSDHRSHLLATLRKLNALLRREPDLQVFLATDNLQVQRLFEAGFPQLVTAPHWLPPPGLAAHSSSLCPDPVEHGIEALVDLYLLAGCRQLIVDTSSSFSRVAVLLTPGPPSSVFDVRWAGFRHEKRPRVLRRVLWHAWRRLGLFNWGLTALRAPLRLQRALRPKPTPR